jgi:hypothetical protein
VNLHTLAIYSEKLVSDPGQPATDFVTLTVTFSVFLTPFLRHLRRSDCPSRNFRKIFFRESKKTSFRSNPIEA